MVKKIKKHSKACNITVTIWLKNHHLL